MLKKSITCMAMIGAVALALASSGGGEKKTATKATPGINTLKSVPGFSLKAGRNYSALSVKNRFNNLNSSNSVITYRKGNTIYIMPAAEKVKPLSGNSKNNLNLLNLKVKLRK